MASIPTFNQIINYGETGNKLTSQYIISPIINLGISGFIFDIRTDESITHTSNSTDHFVEDNSAIQDHIALPPYEISVSGIIGELVHRKERGKNTLEKTVEKLSTLNALVPQITAAAQQARKAIDAQTTQEVLNESLNGAVDLYSVFKNLNTPDTAQAKAYNFFRSLLTARQLVSIDTPYGFHSQMQIKSLKVMARTETNMISDFEVTLKEFSFASTTEIEFDQTEFQGRAKAQSSPTPENSKKAKGKTRNSSILFDAYQSLVN